MLSEEPCGLPVPDPRPDAVEAGLFGWTAAGPMRPDALQVRALTKEHAHEMLSLLSDIRWLERSLKHGTDPATGTAPKSTAGARRLKTAADEVKTLQAHYEAMLSAYEDGFGSDAADQLDRFLNMQLVAVPTIQNMLF